LRDYQTDQERAKEEATKQLLETEAADVRRAARDAIADVPKPKNDMFVLPTKKEKRGEGQHIVENWVKDEKNDKMDFSGEILVAKTGNSHQHVNPADRRKVGEPEDSADWVAVRDQNNDIVHIRADRLHTKPEAEKEIGDIAKKEEEGKELTEDETKIKVALETMDKELAEINKDDGAVLDPDAVENPQTRKPKGQRLQEMREKLKALRNIKDDEAFRRMETKLAEAQHKHDHPGLAPDGHLKINDDGIYIAGDAPHKAPGVYEGGLLQDPPGTGIRRRRSSRYNLGTQAFHVSYRELLS
jgi:hypothetical protein